MDSISENAILHHINPRVLCHYNGQSLILCTKKMKYFKDHSQQQQWTRDLDIAPEQHTFQSSLKSEVV